MLSKRETRKVRLTAPLLLHRDALAPVALLSHVSSGTNKFSEQIQTFQRMSKISWNQFEIKAQRMASRVILGAICKSCKYDYHRILFSRCPCTIKKQNIPYYFFFFGGSSRHERADRLSKQSIGKAVINLRDRASSSHLTRDKSFLFFFSSEGRISIARKTKTNHPGNKQKGKDNSLCFSPPFLLSMFARPRCYVVHFIIFFFRLDYARRTSSVYSFSSVAAVIRKITN